MVARSILLRGNAGIIGNDSQNFLICDRETGPLFALGQPDREVIGQALRRYPRAETLIATPEHSGALGKALEGWDCSRVGIHVLPECQGLARGYGEIRWLETREILQVENGPELLRDNLLAASLRSPIAAAMAGGEPVSFCFASSQTERFWNVSVECLPAYRRMGFSSLCVRWMVEHFLAAGKRPVWGAAESNAASCALAGKLGFTEVDVLAVFSNAQHGA